MHTIATSLPVSLQDMKTLITTPNATASVSYKDSKLKGRAALIYLTNVSLPSFTFDVTGADKEEVFALIDSYITQKSTIRIDGLLTAVAILLLRHKQIPLESTVDPSVNTNPMVCEEDYAAYMANPLRATNLERLCELLDNVVTFAITCSTGFKAVHPDLNILMPVVDDIDYTGMTFVNLLEWEWFTTSFYTVGPTTGAKYFKQQYDEYIYGGKNLFSFVSNTFLIAALNLFLTDVSTVTSVLSLASQEEVPEEITQ